MSRKLIAFLLSITLGVPALAEESRCYGTVSRGRLEGGVPLPRAAPTSGLPHRTHQNGLSVDFFVPVIDKTGSS